MRHVSIVVLGTAALTFPTAGPAFAATGYEVSTGLEYEEGRYGTDQKIETSSLPVGLRVSAGAFHFGASLPYVRIDAPGNVVGGGLLGLPIIVDPTRPATRDRREGVGDLRLGAAYTLPGDAVGLTLSSEVKLPTASAARGLGTGEMDYSLGMEVSKPVGRVTPFVALGYTVAGDPEGFDLRNSLSARAGAALRMSDAVRGHIAYVYAQNVSPLIADEQQIATGLQTGLSERLSLGVYGSAGLSEGAPNIAAGVQLGFRVR